MSIPAAMQVILFAVVGGLIFWLLWWLIDYVGLPEPFNKVARAVLAILAVFVLIGLLLSFISGQPVFRP